MCYEGTIVHPLDNRVLAEVKGVNTPTSQHSPPPPTLSLAVSRTPSFSVVRAVEDETWGREEKETPWRVERWGTKEGVADAMLTRSRRDVFTYTSLAKGLNQMDVYRRALGLIRRMSEEGIKRDGLSLACFLSAAAGSATVGSGKQLHGYAVKSGLTAGFLSPTASSTCTANAGASTKPARLLWGSGSGMWCRGME